MGLKQFGLFALDLSELVIYETAKIFAFHPFLVAEHVRALRGIATRAFSGVFNVLVAPRISHPAHKLFAGDVLGRRGKLIAECVDVALVV